MVTLSEVLTSIKTELRLFAIKFPYDNLDEKLIEILKVKTLPSFSIKCPFFETYDFDIRKLKKVTGDYKRAEYIIPPLYGDRTIVFIRDVSETGDTSYDDYIDYNRFGSPCMFQDVLMAQASADLHSTVSPSVHFNFKAPNRMILFNVSSIYTQRIRVELALSHKIDMSTIPFSQYEAFMELALLDVKRILYADICMFSDISTPVGTYNMKIVDDWSSAESDRRELIKQWKESHSFTAKQANYL